MQALMRGEEGLPAEEVEELKHIAPGMWWQRLGPCCPECGKAGTKVGTSFKAPSKDNIGGWEELRVWIENGGELQERESFEREVAEEKRRRCQGGYYEHRAEKRKPIETLQQAVALGVRTSEEEKKLAIIRSTKGKTVDEAWAVVVGPAEGT